MTTTFNLRFPTDIPWVRKCVSEDMLDRHLCDGERPYRWRSSIAVFEYQPDDQNQNYPDLIISYLKITCSITGYQEDPDEIGLDYKGLKSYWKDQPGIVDYVDHLQKYYPCYGAVLEVSVGTATELIEKYTFKSSEQPYILNFEPKKRELYELATDTKERQSRSVEALNITKSAGSTQSVEVFDIDMGGGGHSQQASFLGTGGGYSYQAPSGQWGTKRMNAEESMASRSIDVGDEKRETFSFSTQMSQLYHQLDSYHLGTNRAVFFVLPRPHTVETEHTFVNGPRNIEGIQEFFLVVARPKDIEHVCVEAYLETGHIAKLPRIELEQIPGTERKVLWSDQYQARPKGGDDEETVYDAADRVWDVNVGYPGYRIINAVLTSGPARIRFNYSEPNLIDEHPHISQQTEDFVKVSGKVHSGFKNYGAGNDRWEEITYPFTVEITIAKMQPVEKSTDTLFITGRNLCCCEELDRRRFEDGIIYERPIKDRLDSPTAPRRGFGMSIAAANQMRTVVKEAIVNSRNDVMHRYEKPIQLHQTDFAARTLARMAPGVENIRVRDLKGLPESIRAKLRDLKENVHVGMLLSMPIEMQRDVFGLNLKEVLQLRSSLTGFNHRTEDSKRAWLSDAQLERLFERKSADSDKLRRKRTKK